MLDPERGAVGKVHDSLLVRPLIDAARDRAAAATQRQQQADKPDYAGHGCRYRSCCHNVPAYRWRQRLLSRILLFRRSDFATGNGVPPALPAALLLTGVQKLMASKRVCIPSSCKLIRLGRQATSSPAACNQPLCTQT